MSAATVEELKRSVWDVVFFGDGFDPRHIQEYKCRDFPRFTKTAVKPRNGDWQTTYAVDGVEIARGEDTEAWLVAVVDALNKEPNQ